MPHQLRNLRIDEVSSVDKGAGEGVRVLLMKRAAAEKPAPSKDEVAHKALQLAVGSILADGGSSEDVVECFKQFHAYLKGDEPKETEMTPDEINKLVAEAVAKALEEAEKKKKPAAPKNDNNVSGDTDGPDATGGGDSATGDTGKSEKAPKAEPKIEKRDEEVAKRDEKIISLEKRLNSMLEKQLVEDFSKRAVSIGLTAAEGEHLRKAYKGEVASLDYLVDTIAKLHKQVEKAGLFGEFGSTAGAPADAHAALLAKAQDIAKSAAEAGKSMTQAQAYVKALEVYPDLAKQEKAEREANLVKHA